MQKIQKTIDESIRVKQVLRQDVETLTKINAAAAMMVSSLKKGGAVYFCGNGGSAADAQHFACELSGRFLFDRPPLRAEALHGNASYMTAVANDYSFDQVYSRLLQAMGRRGDVLFAISTSGNSRNILEALKAANGLGMATIGLTGSTGGKMMGMCEILITVPSADTPRIQEAHVMIGHIICGLVEEDLFGTKEKVSRK